MGTKAVVRRARTGFVATAAVLALGLGMLLGCRGSSHEGPPAAPPGDSAAKPSPTRQAAETSTACGPGTCAGAALIEERLVSPTPPDRVYAVLLSGGADRASNYQSHLVHLRGMLDAIASTGVPASHVTVFASDGSDPATDLAILEAPLGGDTWLLDGTRVGGRLIRPIEFVSTEIDGVEIRPATMAALRDWVETTGRGLGPGDTLLLFVTDHGTRAKDEGGTRISLWGRENSLSSAELDGLLADLDPSVHVVAVMSQCFSGGFATLGRSSEDNLPTGRVCGYFSTTGDREAFGCYPENRGAQNVGHAVRFIEALDETGSLPASQERVLISDRTPDVPLRSSDVQLEALLGDVARREGRTKEDLADELLAEAWRDPTTTHREARLLDATAQSFGVMSPRSVGEVDGELTRLRETYEPLAYHTKAWKVTLDELAEANLNRFLAARPDWTEPLQPAAIDKLDADQARALGERLIEELRTFTQGDADTYERIAVLRERVDPAEKVVYRMKSREAAYLRMRLVLYGIAGRRYLATRATPRERTAFAALEECETLALGAALRPGAGGALALDPEPELPVFAEDVRLAQQLRPAWLGISFDEAKPEIRDKYGLGAGAVEVREVLPSSPASRAGLEVGDIIVGPPGRPFVERRQVREWTMLWPAGEPAELEVLHHGSLETRMIIPAPHPGAPKD